MKKRNGLYLSITMLFFSFYGLLYSQESWEPLWKAKNSTRQGQGINVVKISNDGSKILSGSTDGTLKIWNARSGSILWNILNDYGDIITAAFSPDGNNVVFGGSGATFTFEVKMFNISTGSIVWTGSHTSFVRELIYSPDGKKVISASSDNSIKVWNAENGALQWTGYHQNEVSAIGISPDGKKIVSGSNDKTIKVWDTDTGSLLWIGNHSSRIWSVNFSPDSRKIISTENESRFKIWNSNDGTLLVDGTMGGQLTDACFSPDGSRTAVASSNTGIKLWNSSTGELIWTSDNLGNINKVSFSADGRKIISASYQKVNLLNANSGQRLWSNTQTNNVSNAVMSQDGKLIATGGWNDSIKVWSYERYAILTSFDYSSRVKAFSTQTIEWISRNVTNIKLEYSIDNGVTWNLIINNFAASNRKYNWSVPSVSSNKCKIRISDADNFAIQYESRENFEIYKPIIILSPVDGEILQAGTLYEIKWINNISSIVTIEYSSDNGVTWTRILNSFKESDTSVKWLIPNKSSSQYKIRIYDLFNPTVKDENTNPFEVYQSLVIKYPNGGEVFKANRIKEISWRNISSDSIKIYYSTDNGNNWLLISDNVNANDGKYNWIAPAITASTCKIKVVDKNNPEINDESDEVFSINQPSLIVTNPTGGENLRAKTKYNITWLSSSVDNIKLEYSNDNGTNWSIIKERIAAADHKYSWTIPDVLSSNCKIKITDVNDAETIGISSGTFSILSFVDLTVTIPNGGEIWKGNRIKDITWRSNNSSFVRIQYSTDSGNNWLPVIDSTTASAGKYSWVVPAITSSSCKIKITDTKYQDSYDTSDAAFSIIQPYITILSPNGGELWMAKTANQIKWTSSLIDNVKLDYSINGGLSWVTLVDNIRANMNRYDWTLPDMASNKCIVRITDITDNQTNAQSKESFSIIPFVDIDADKGQIPLEYELGQNYPNPFNPTTNINYKVKEGGQVSLKVYDLLGKEIAILVNEFKNPGSYIYEFSMDKNMYPSGTYFYQLKTGSFVATKKLVLMK